MSLTYPATPRLGVAVVHIPTNTTIYIDAAGTEETRSITRAELVTDIRIVYVFVLSYTPYFHIVKVKYG